MTYFKDWFSRDADYGYTYYDPSKRSISWDKGYKNYSDFLFGGTNRVKMEEAASLIRTMSRVMGVNYTGFGKKQTESVIKIPSDLLQKHDAGNDVFLGASLQNMARFIHQSISDRSSDFFDARNTTTASKLIAQILNEERIGKIMAQDTPGYLRFVQKYKEYKYKDRPTPKNDYQHLIELFDRIIRYPEQITEDELSKFAEPIDKIKKVLSNYGGVPATYDECRAASKKIAKIMSEYITPPEEKEPEKGEGEGESSTGKGGGGFGGGDSDTEEEAELTDKEFLEKMNQLINTDDDDTDTLHSFLQELKFVEEVESDVSGSKSKIDYVVVQGNCYSDAEYKDVISKIDMSKASVLGTLLARKNRDYQFALRSMRSGRLDTNKLAEAVQGVPTIYERIGKVTTNKLCVTILVDESGSMMGSKAIAARQAAIFLNEALSKVKDVELFIYGHTADWSGGYGGEHGINPDSCSGSFSTQLLIYKEPGMPISTNLGHISGKYENRDGAAIIAAAKRVRSKTQSQGVFVVISDGSPHAAGYSGETARKHVQRMANETESLGFEVIQVTIGGYRSADMFKNVIDMDNVNKFPEQFVNFLKKKIYKLIKEKVTL